jgi:hypothetical protein
MNTIENIMANERRSLLACFNVSVNNDKRELKRQKRTNLIVPKKQQKPSKYVKISLI